MKFMRYVRLGSTKADKIRDETIRLDLNIFLINNLIEVNKTKIMLVEW